ncbi:MAG TPA: hypothetical protein VMY42_02740 [Thermoguttaceae bacterium]|nr:hypothetical protein [Thermoguttaceae bacterium]
MFHFHWQGKQGWATMLSALIVPMILFAQQSSADEIDAIGNPLVDETQIMLMYVSPTTSGFSYAFLEGWRQWGLAFADISRNEERQAMLAAITTHAILQVDKSVRTSAAGSEIILQKLRDDQRYYEDLFPDFRTRLTPPTDADEQRYYGRYSAIKDVVDGPGQRLKQAAESAIAAIETVRTRLGQGGFILRSLESQNSFLMKAMNLYYQRLQELEKALTDLNESGASPRKHLRVIFKNESDNLVFFVQVMPRDNDGKYEKIREDTRYPIPIYPNAPPASEQSVEPKQQRGPNRFWFTVKPWDKIIARVATMGPIRDKVRFQPIVGNLVKPDLNSLERGFYWMGYNTKQPTKLVPIFTRLYSKQESYTWEFRGGWAPGESANDPTFSTGIDMKALQQGLGYVWPGHVGFSGEQIEWVLPSSLDSAAEYGAGYADVSGTTTYQKVGPTVAQRDDLTESGKGRLRLLVEKW